MTVQFRGKTYQRADGQEIVADARWVETRNGAALVVPYVYRGQRNRLQALTRERVERGLGGPPGA